MRGEGLSVTIRTGAGALALTPIQLRELLCLGRVRPFARIVSLDGGATWLGVVEALCLLGAAGRLAEDRPLRNDGHASSAGGGWSGSAPTSLPDGGPGCREGVQRRGSRRYAG